MKRLLIGVVLLVGCAPIYVKLAKKVVPKSVQIVVPTVINQISLTFKDGGFEMSQSTVTVMVTGSGVFISPNGHILTCAHLFNVGVSTSMMITASNGISLPGTLIYQDTSKDLALVKVGGQWPYAVL